MKSVFFTEMNVSDTRANSCFIFSSLFVAIAIEAFNKLGTLDEDPHQLRPHIERQASEQRPPTVDV